MACPFFIPTHPLEGGAWLHPSRLPLGAGWAGCCGAPGHEGCHPTVQELQELCNLGYASKCGRLPKDRSYDAVRFSVARDTGAQLLIWFACEAGHYPCNHGQLEYNPSLTTWVSSHQDPQIQKLAECYVQSYLTRKSNSSLADISSSPPHDAI